MLCKGVRVSPIPDSFQNTAESLRGCHENTLSNGSQSRADNSLAGPPADLLPSPGPLSNGSCTDPREQRNIPRDNHQPAPGHVIQFFPGG